MYYILCYTTNSSIYSFFYLLDVLNPHKALAAPPEVKTSKCLHSELRVCSSS